MARITHLDRPKSIDDISQNARTLLKRLGMRGQNTLRLTGTPLELIGRGLAMYDVVDRGYDLEITESGAGLLRIAGICLEAQPRAPYLKRIPLPFSGARLSALLDGKSSNKNWVLPRKAGTLELLGAREANT